MVIYVEPVTSFQVGKAQLQAQSSVRIIAEAINVHVSRLAYETKAYNSWHASSQFITVHKVAVTPQDTWMLRGIEIARMSKTTRANGKNLSWLTALSIALGAVSGVVSVFGAGDNLGLELFQNCHLEAFRRSRGVTLVPGLLPLDWSWCLLTTFVKGFAESRLSVGLMQLVVSAVIPIWGYLAAVMMSETPAGVLRPLPVTILVLVSQIFGFQGILTIYWIPLMIKQRNWIFTRSVFREGAAKAVLWTVVLQLLAGSIIIAINVNNEWWYQRTQIVFQFYPVMTPAVYLAFRMFGSDKRSQQQFEISRAFERLGLLSLSFWWTGVIFLFFGPNASVSSLRQPSAMYSAIINPALTAMWQSFPHWKFAFPRRDTDVFSSGQLFCIFDILLMAFSTTALIYIELNRRSSHGANIKARRVVSNTLAGGPGFMFATEMALLFRDQRDDTEGGTAKSKRS